MPYSGTKLQLAQRLLSHEITSNDPGLGDIIGDLVKCWFLKPIRSDSMKSGTLNEDLIQTALPRFFARAVTQWVLSSQREFLFEWLEAIEVGLVCLKNKRYMGTSADLLVRVSMTPVPPLVHTIPHEIYQEAWTGTSQHNRNQCVCFSCTCLQLITFLPFHL